jgi:hypothetical protein
VSNIEILTNNYRIAFRALTVSLLRARATEAKIVGRSTMNKAALVTALAEREAAMQDEIRVALLTDPSSASEVAPREAAMIEAAIAHEEWCRKTAAPEDAHFWDGWAADAVRGGRVTVTVTTSASGTGHVVVVTSRAVVMVGDKAVAYVPDTEKTERVDARVIRRAGGGDAYAAKIAAQLYGNDLPVKFRHIV